MSSEPEFFVITEGSSGQGGPQEPADGRRAGAASALVHFLILAFLVAGSSTDWFSWNDESAPGEVRVRFYLPGEGEGGGGGGGGQEGERMTAYIPVRVAKPEPEPPETPEPRRAAITPRKPRPLNFDDLDVPDLPRDTALLFEGAFSPDAVEFPGLSLTDSRDWGGVDTERSSGSGGGIGGGTGTGVGTGEGWGVGPGRGGGFGGGDFSPGGWDIEPTVIYKPPAPDYPALAREKMVAGEVILQVRVRLDGSTEVLRVIKSLPYCIDAAMENARLWRWKPALKGGKPIEAKGIITVTFDIFAQANAKS